MKCNRCGAWVGSEHSSDATCQHCKDPEVVAYDLKQLRESFYSVQDIEVILRKVIEKFKSEAPNE